MLHMEDLVDGGQRDILVAATVAADEVLVEQFIIIRRPPRTVSRLSASHSIGISGSWGAIMVRRVCAVRYVV